MKHLIFLILVIVTLKSSFVHGKYDVHWLNAPIKVYREPKVNKNIDIYCYTGTAKSILALWQTVKFNIKTKSGYDDFYPYIGGSPDEVYNEYVENSYGWSVNPFQRKPARTINLELFNSTCLTVKTSETYEIELNINRIDIWRVLLMVFGITTVFLSRVLSGNPIFYYFSGILIGVCASFMVLVYYISKFLPKKTLTYGLLVGGWTVGVYIFQQVWENIRNIMLTYQNYVFWYTIIIGFASFLICYRIGPPKNRRSQNLVMWTLQLVGVIMIFFSSDYQEAAAAIIFLTLGLKYFPNSLTYHLKSYWHRKFPPQPHLLSSEEYYEEGARETKQALESLRKYCSSPDCAQWKIMLKLNDSKRFASFVEGNSHLSDDEVLDYESYAFSSDRNHKSNIINSTANNLEISDDDSSESDDY